MNNHRLSTFLSVTLLQIWVALSTGTAANDGLLYDSTAYTECKEYPENPLYKGGILKNEVARLNGSIDNTGFRVHSPAFALTNLTQDTKYCLSSWVKIKGAESALVRATLSTENRTYNCIGSVIARPGCWSFLKGGFILDSPSSTPLLYFQSADGTVIDISIASYSLQPFTDEEWKLSQEYRIKTKRKRAVILHVTDRRGKIIQGSQVSVKQISKDFSFGCAITKSILGNLPYQEWFVKRFNAVAFENELKWNETEPKQGHVNYTIPDQMLEFIRANQIVARGHNIFWEDPHYTPPWVLNLTKQELRAAVTSRIQSLLTKYKGEFAHWDVSNEMLHYHFYEEKLGPNATLEFFLAAHKYDPFATLFVNDYNVMETCVDNNSTVDSFILKIRELKSAGATMEGIGLEGHFSVPNLPLMRSNLDKLSTLGLPIWLTEVDISKYIDSPSQPVYLEQVLREGFSHPYVKGIMLWSALSPNGCFQMCLTDDNLHNLPTGDVVDKLLLEWQTETLGQTDEDGSYYYSGFLGEYNVNVQFGNRSVNSTFSLSTSEETKHFSIQL